MNDRELLTRAAKAAGLQVDGLVDEMVAQPPVEKVGGFVVRNERGGHSMWNPLTDDGDALRLAVKLNIHITISEFGRVVCRQGQWTRAIEPFGDDRYAATRLAIVKTAAEIGAAAALEQESGQ